MADALQPADFKRRPFLYRKLAEAGADFVDLGGAAMAADYGNPDAELERAQRLGLADLSVLPRGGFKGAGTPDWLTAQGLSVPEDSNRALRQSDGTLAARLAPTEILLLSDVAGEAGTIADLEATWNAAPQPPQTPRGYPLPRRDSHAWFLVTGAEAAGMFAKVCGVDLRPVKFEPGQIAQTSIARANGIVIRDDLGATLAYHLLVDSASADFFWPAILDAMAEFGGGPVGHSALLALAGGQ